MNTEFSIIGRPRAKVDSFGKVTGAARYADDIKLPRMLYGRLLRSPHAHARVLSIDTRRAEALPGVLAVATGADAPTEYGIMPSTQDETVFAIDKVRYAGEPVAAVAAVDPETAERAVHLIDVKYEPLPAIMSIDEALSSPVRIHEGHEQNIHKRVELQFGDVEEGFAEADYVREDVFFYGGNTHAPMENHAVVADYSPSGKLTVWSSTQTPHYVHRNLAKVLGLPLSRIRVIVPAVGGGFGGKSDPLNHEFAAAILSRKAGRPVKICLTREEVFYCHRGRHPVRMWIKTGVKKDGSITAVHLKTCLDGGAYGSYGIATVYYTGALLTVTYKVPRYKFEGMRVFTNKPPCGPKRGHGSTQPRYAFEVQLDKIAEAIGLDPAEMRRRHVVEPNSMTVNHLRITSCGLRECIDRVVERSGWRHKRGRLPRGQGIGFACSSYVSGAGLPIYWNDMPHSGVLLKVDRGGGVAVFCGTSDIGQGSDAMLAAIVAEELGVELADVQVFAGDTDMTPVDLGSYSSRVTFMAGNAAKQAAARVKEMLFAAAAEKLGVPAERLAAARRRIYCQDDPEKFLPFAEAAVLAESKFGTLGAVGSYKPPKLAGPYKGSGVGPSPAYSYNAAAVQVRVDEETGQIRVEKVWIAHDCGRALNPNIVEGQIEGSAYMGLGEAMMEEQLFRHRIGLYQNPSLLDYKLATSLDTPEIEAMIVESIDPEGPFGAKEAGEGPLNPVIPALANAIYDAVGLRIDSTPITPEKLLRALEQRAKATAKEGDRRVAAARV